MKRREAKKNVEPAEKQPPARLFTPYERVPQPGGCVLLKPGKPVVLEDMVGLAEVARIFGMSRRWAQAQCDLGRFKTAWKPGGKIFSQWRVSRAEIMEMRGANEE
jgi:hypothetical protein